MPVFRLEQIILPAPSCFQQLLPLEGIAASVAEALVNRDEPDASVAADEPRPGGAVYTMGKPVVLHARDRCIECDRLAFWFGS